jgi:predicted amidophosphoribosyltransferase
VACASQTFERIARDACPVCSQVLGDDGLCPNWLCRDPRRRIDRIHAIAYQTGPLRQVINNYKYRGARGWSLIFGRLVLGWLEEHATRSPPGLIVVNPAYTGTDGREFAHAEAVLEAAAREDVLCRWPFDSVDPRAIVKIRATARSASATAKAKRAAAQELRSALSVPNPSRTAGQRILVYDDICTTASQLDSVAACLLDDGGASCVEALVLARAPWIRRT